jgi:signal transduction histidine kinase
MSEFLSEHGIRLFGMDGHALAPEQWATLRALRNGEKAVQHQEIIRHPDGTTLPVLANAVPLDASHLVALSAEGTKGPAEGTDAAALVVYQDITTLKEAERLKDEFIAIAAHELRTPLAVLKGYAQTLLFQHQQRRGPQLEEWQQEALQNIDKATLRLTELTEELLDVTRLQAGRLELHLEPMDLVALSRRLVRRLQMTTELHRLSLRMSPDYLVVSCDPGRMEQVLSNLLGNAIKYSPEGGSIEVALWEERERGEAILSVRDAGIGIPAQEQARIFGRFARAKNARQISGTGLGLYLCRALVEQHGGRIWFESVEGKGSTFFIALPLFTDEDAGER